MKMMCWQVYSVGVILYFAPSLSTASGGKGRGGICGDDAVYQAIHLYEMKPTPPLYPPSVRGVRRSRRPS